MGHRVDNSLGQIAMWIEQCEAATGGQVGEDEGKNECGFAGAGFADDVEMASAVILAEIDRTREIEARSPDAEIRGVVDHGSVAEPEV